jgi:hypothetical protein
MSRAWWHRLLPLALLGVARVLPAQGVWDASARLGPQIVQYNLKAPINEKITEFAIPIYLLVPITEAFSVDLGTAWTSARVEGSGTSVTASSRLSGLTDTQIRANYVLGTDFVVLTAGLDLPTGQTDITADQLEAATRIASDFLLFPINGFGAGAGGTAGVAMARPLGEWNVGFGVALRHALAYDAFRDVNGDKFRFAPGNEYRARAGVDHPYGTGRISFGLTYSTFGRDQANGSVYNTGDRYITQASITNSVGDVDLTVSGWDLFRASGTLLDSTATGRENIADAGFAAGFHTSPNVILEPSLEGRVWAQEAQPTSYLGTLGLRVDFDLGGYAVTPSAGYSVGRVGGSAGTASLTGFHATLAIRVGGG